nr:hypothetical protein Iba_chr13fCG6550 [Ipomoea batatas]
METRLKEMGTPLDTADMIDIPIQNESIVVAKQTEFNDKVEVVHVEVEAMQNVVKAVQNEVSLVHVLLFCLFSFLFIINATWFH